jgi:hypothetical protein
MEAIVWLACHECADEHRPVSWLYIASHVYFSY